jgi:hypothetical protein
MGSWYETCALTNLPILEDDKVCMFVIVENHDNCGGNCGAYGEWAPLTLPIHGKYNDYGGITGYREDWFTKHFEAWFNASLANRDIIIPQDERERNDEIDFSKQISFKDALYLIGRECVFQCESWMPEKRLLRMRLMYILEEAYNHAVKTIQAQVVKASSDDGGEFRAGCLMRTMERLSNAHKDYVPFDFSAKKTGIALSPEEREQMSQSFMSQHKIADEMSFDEKGSTLRWMLHFDMFASVHQNWDNFFERIGRVKSLVVFMELTRHSFYYTSGKGSQEMEYEESIELAKETIRIAKLKLRRFDE